MPRRRRHKPLLPRPPGRAPREVQADVDKSRFEMGWFDDMSPAMKAALRCTSDFPSMVAELIMVRGIPDATIIKHLQQDKEFDRTANDPPRCRRAHRARRGPK